MKKMVYKYLSLFTPREIEQLKIMTEHNILCGVSFTKDNNLDVYKFNKELKTTLEEK